MTSVKYLHDWTTMDGEKVKENLEFSLNRTELAKNMHLKTEFEEMAAIIAEERRELTPAEVRKMFLLIEELMRLTYGVRGEKGGRVVHIKNPEIWESFEESGCYDSFIFWLFADTKRANDFMDGLMPAELREDAAKMGEEQAERGVIQPSETPIAPEGGNGRPKREVKSKEEILADMRERQARELAAAEARIEAEES